jgi:hypothetical protein
LWAFLVNIMTFEDHEPGMPLYVSEELRTCPGCKEGKNILPLKKFHKGEGREYSTLCSACEKEDRKFEEIQASQSAVAILSDTMKEVKRSLKGGVHRGYGDVLKIACDGMGGIEKTFTLVGSALQRAMDTGTKKDADVSEMTLAVKAAQTLLSSASAENNKKNSVDLSNLTEEELQDILMGPAKNLLLTSRAFRKQMLNHPDVRAVFAKDIGVKIIDGELRDPE